MKYGTFEKLVILIATITTLGAILVVSFPPPDMIEVFAQLLLLCVVVAAVHYGPRGGAFVSMIAVVFYVLLRSPMIAEGAESQGQIVQLLAIRAALFGGIGIIGGEICSRIKYLFTKMEHHDLIDDVTGLFNRTHVLNLIDNYCQRYERYGTGFSVLTIDFDPGLFSGMKLAERDRLFGHIGTIVRHGVRAVDEVGRLGVYNFTLILPSTPKAGAETALARLRGEILKTRKKAMPDIAQRAHFAALPYPEDKDRILAFLPKDGSPKPIPAPDRLGQV